MPATAKKLMNLERAFHRLIPDAAHTAVLADILTMLHERSLRFWFIAFGDDLQAASTRSTARSLPRSVSATAPGPKPPCAPISSLRASTSCARSEQENPSCCAPERSTSTRSATANVIPGSYLRFATKLLTAPRDDELIVDRQEVVLEKMAQMNDRLADGRPWLCGDSFTLADIALAPRVEMFPVMASAISFNVSLISAHSWKG